MYICVVYVYINHITQDIKVNTFFNSFSQQVRCVIHAHPEEKEIFKNLLFYILLRFKYFQYISKS